MYERSRRLLSKGEKQMSNEFHERAKENWYQDALSAGLSDADALNYVDWQIENEGKGNVLSYIKIGKKNMNIREHTESVLEEIEKEVGHFNGDDRATVFNILSKLIYEVDCNAWQEGHDDASQRYFK